MHLVPRPTCVPNDAPAQRPEGYGTLAARQRRDIGMQRGATAHTPPAICLLALARAAGLTVRQLVAMLASRSAQQSDDLHLIYT